VTWRIERDLIGNETRAVVGYHSRSEADEVAPAIAEHVGGVVGVSIDDPGRAWVSATARYELTWPGTVVATEVRSRIESDAEGYQVHLEIDAEEDGSVRWSRRFDRRFARDLQ
jgi:hypothetical protein